MRPKGSVSALCLKHGITRHQFNHRQRMGWTLEETLGIVERKRVESDPDEINRLLRAWKR